MSAYDHAAVTRAERRRGAGPCDAERAYWPKYTLGEVAKHVSLKDGWIVIYERVFDITTFAITHPGFHNAGQVSTALAITRNLGKDCTEEFVSIHSGTAWAQLHDFQIGVLLRDGDLAPLGPVAPEDVDVVPPKPPGQSGTTLSDEAVENPHPVPRRNHRPTPRWLTKDRHFWSRYGGGVDANVLRYLDAQGYAQSAGGVEDVDDDGVLRAGQIVSSTPDKKEDDGKKMRRSPSGKLLAALALGATMKAVRSFGDLATTFKP
jgi:glycosylphosphatidylinositol deacylase